MDVLHSGTSKVVDADAALLLLREILADLRRLPGASCIGHHDLYDDCPGRGHQHHDQQRAHAPELAEHAARRTRAALRNRPRGLPCHPLRLITASTITR